MRKIGDIHVFEDEAFLCAIKRDSLKVAVTGFAVAALWGFGMTVLLNAHNAPVDAFELDQVLGTLGLRMLGREGSASVNIFWWVSLVLGTLASFGAHELVHAFFFRQYAPPGTRISFGVNTTTGMLYASAEGVVYPRAQYLVIALSPSVLVTLLVVAVGLGLGWPLWTIVVATVHLSGCVGDWGYVRAIRANPAITHCRDTDFGVEFYGENIRSTVSSRLGAVRPTVPTQVERAGEGDISKGSAAEASRSVFTVVDGGKSS